MTQKIESSDRVDESVVSEMSATEKMFKEKIESNFGKMTKEEIIASLVSHVTSLSRTIERWEEKGMNSKGKDRKEWQNGANRMRDERFLITRLFINLDEVKN